MGHGVGTCNGEIVTFQMVSAGDNQNGLGRISFVPQPFSRKSIPWTEGVQQSVIRYFPLRLLLTLSGTTSKMMAAATG
jgi:hypothetical protein